MITCSTAPSFQKISVHGLLEPSFSSTAIVAPMISVMCCASAQDHGAWGLTLPDLAGALTEGLVRAFRCALTKRSHRLKHLDLATAGLESPWLNDFVITSRWETEAAWKWPRPVHINILEVSTFSRLLKSWPLSGEMPASSLLLTATSADAPPPKGEAVPRPSPSHLTAVLQRRRALDFMPRFTRLMPADNPSQGSEPDPPGPGLGVQCLPAHLSRALLALPRIRLVLLLGFRPLPSGDSSLRYAAWSFRLFACPPLDFDSTLGFSGEGPCTLSLAAAAVCLVCLVV